MAQSGANISTGINDGEAHVMHWEQTNNELAKIQQRDITNQQYLRAQYDKMKMQMADAAAQMRPADQPEFYKNLSKFKEAGLMLQSPKISKDSTQRAYWEGIQQDALYNNLSLATQSKEQTERFADIYKQAFTNPGAFVDFPELQERMKLAEGMTIHQIRATGFNTPLPFLHTPDTYKESGDLAKSILGDEKEATNNVPVHDKNGAIIGWTPKKYGQYTRPLSLVASEAARSLGNQSYAKNAQSEWASMTPEQREQRIKEGQAIIDGDPNSKGQVLPTDYRGLYIAKWLVNANQKRDMGEGKFEVNPEWLETKKLEGQKDLKKMGFDYGMRLAEYRNQLSLNLFKEKQASKQISSIEAGNKFYQLLQNDAYNHPQTYKHADGTTEIQYKVNVDPQTKKLFATQDPLTQKMIYPDEVRLLQNGDVLPIFWKRTIKDGKASINENKQTGFKEIDTEKSQPVKKEQFKIRLSKSLLTGKAANEDIQSDLNDDDTDTSYNAPSLPENAMSGLLRLVNSNTA